MILYPTNYEIRSNAIYKKNKYTKKEGKITPGEDTKQYKNIITHSTHVYIYIYVFSI